MSESREEELDAAVAQCQISHDKAWEVLEIARASYKAERKALSRAIKRRAICGEKKELAVKVAAYKKTDQYRKDRGA